MTDVIGLWHRIGMQIALEDSEFPPADSPEQARLLEPVRQLDEQGQPVWRVDCAITGMTCGLCSITLEQQLGALTAVRQVSVNPASHTATLLISDPGSVLQIERLIHRLGYTCASTEGHSALLYARQQSRTTLWRLLVAVLCMMQIMMYSAPEYVFSSVQIGPQSVVLLRWAQWMMSIPLMLFCARPIFKSAWDGVKGRRVSMDLPAALGLLITFVASSLRVWSGEGEVWFDSLAMFLSFLLLARWLEATGREKAIRYLHGLTQDIPLQALRRDHQSHFVSVSVHDLHIGDFIRVHAGQRIPADGKVVEGFTQVDESLLTGESHPQPKGPDDGVLAGSINLAGSIDVVITATGRDSSVGRLGDWIRQALATRPQGHTAITRWAPWVLVLTLLASAFSGFVWWWIDPSRAMQVAVTVMIVTCPCALSVAVPAALQAATLRLARAGMIVRHPHALESLAQVTRAVFDKTGTLVQRQVTMQLRWLGARDLPWSLIMLDIALRSSHPTSRALARTLQSPPTRLPATGEVTQALPRLPQSCRWQSLNEHISQGVEARYWCGEPGLEREVVIRLGSAAWCQIDAAMLAQQGLEETSSLWASCRDGLDSPWEPILCASGDTTDDPAAAHTIGYLQSHGIECDILSGDHSRATQRIGQILGVNTTLSGQTADMKRAYVANLQAHGEQVLMVGDGLNDAAVLTQADVSVAMAQASQLTAQQADVLLLRDDVGMIKTLYQVARKTGWIIRQNLLWALAYNIISIPLAATGVMPPWLASIGMAFSSMVVVTNASRLTRLRL